MDNVFDTLQQRGFVEQVTSPQVAKVLANPPVTAYVGFDPTAASLHLGHVVPLMALAHLQRAGHKVLVLIGGATGMVGDPSGRSSERNLLGPEQVALHAQGVRKQMERFFCFEGAGAARLLNNNDWISTLSFVDWLREVGKHFGIGYMLGKESVKSRLASEQGISFTEFAYMTMQAYDFLHLFDEFGCCLQGGGNDQWGNITAGIDLIHKVRGKQVHGITFPLITTSSGAKFGKSAGNAVWLDPVRTSPFRFYQYWVNTDDADVERFLKLFTFLALPEIQALCEAHRNAPERRGAQTALASETTRLVHGEKGLERAQAATAALFGGELGALSEEDILDIFADVPSTTLPASQLCGGPLVDLLVSGGICKSKGEARRLLEQGGVSVNGRRVATDEKVTAAILESRSVLVVRLGKKRFHLLKFE